MTATPIAAFEEAKARWYSRPKVLCHSTKSNKGMVPSPFAHPEPEKCEGNIVHYGSHGDGGWNVCMDSTLRHDGADGRDAPPGGHRCAAYLIGAGSDITFDMEFAIATKCNVFTIDPTPGLAQRLSSHRGIASLIYTKRKALIERILTRGPPPNWRHVNVGVAASDSTTRWEIKGGWAGSHARFLNLTSVDPTVKLQSVRSLMSSLGHASVQLVKMDAEGAEWQLTERLVTQTKLQQIMLEMHAITPKRLFGVYEQFLRHGLTLMGQAPVRYINGNSKVDNWFVANKAKLKLNGLPTRPPFVFQHVRYMNASMCGNALGEFHFYRPPSVATTPVSWRYTSVDYQYTHE